MPLNPGSITPPAQILSAGAGAQLRVHWPHDLTDAGAGTALAKFGGAASDAFNPIAFGGGVSVTALVDSAYCNVFQSTGAGVGVGAWRDRRASWFTEQPQATLFDPEACFSHRATLCWPGGIAATTGDVGLVFSMDGFHDVNADGAGGGAGVIFGPVGPGVLNLRARRVHGGAFTVAYQVPASLTPNLARWATYELRVVTGIAGEDPYLVGLINGVEVTPRFSWTAAAGLLPPPNAEAGQWGYAQGVVLRSNGVIPTMGVHGIDVQAAETVLGLS